MNVVIEMKALLFIILISSLTMAFPTTAHADFEDGDVVPASVIAPLMSWVEAQTGIHTAVLPQVIVSHTRLSSIVSRMGPIAGRARALFTGGVVVLDDRSFDLEDETQISLLVHELVHYAQSFKHNGGWACPQAKEVEAYTLQNQWLEERGHSPFVRASWINRMASCPNTASAVAVASAD